MYLLRLKSFVFLILLFASSPYTTRLFAANYVVNVAGDTSPSTQGSGSGSNGDLRWVLNQINIDTASSSDPSCNVTFNLSGAGTNTITLAGMLPLLNLTNTNTLTIDGGNGGDAGGGGGMGAGGGGSSSSGIAGNGGFSGGGGVGGGGTSGSGGFGGGGGGASVGSNNPGAGGQGAGNGANATSGSSYGAGNSDLINVGGNATLSGGQVIITSLTGTALINTPYLILTAAGGVTGTFSNAITTNLRLKPTLIYDANHAYVVFRFDFDALTPNQIAVATQLEDITNPTAEELLILDTLSTLSPAEQRAALNQMSGEQYASLSFVSEIAGRQLIRRLYDPIRILVTTKPDDDYFYECPIPTANGCCYSYLPPTLDTWFELSGGQSFLTGNTNARGLKLSGFEATFGAQSTFCHSWTAGVAGSLVADHMNFDIGNTGKNCMGFGALYGLYRPSHFYVLADLALGYGQFTVNRSINIGTLAYRAKSHPNHYQGIGYIEAGFDWNAKNFLIQLFLGFEGGYFSRKRISETGTSPLNLTINKQSYGNAYSRLGLHMTKPMVKT